MAARSKRVKRAACGFRITLCILEAPPLEVHHMSNDAASQVESNYAIYLDKYKDEAERYHKGEVALMVNCEIIEYFPTASDAYDAGCERYGLGNFSIQEIGAAPIGLGAQTLELL